MIDSGFHLQTSGQDRLRRQLVDAVTADKASIPEAGRLLWSWFRDLSEARSSGFGANPISFGEIEAYARLRRIPLQPWHVRTIRAMDRALLASWRETRATAPDGITKLPPVSKQKITPQLFDVMFS